MTTPRLNGHTPAPERCPGCGHQYPMHVVECSWALIHGRGEAERVADEVHETLTEAGWVATSAEKLAAGRVLNMPRSERVAVAEEYLAGLHSTLWGTFDVMNAARRKEAAEWLVTETDRFAALLRRHVGGSGVTP